MPICAFRHVLIRPAVFQGEVLLLEMMAAWYAQV